MSTGLSAARDSVAAPPAGGLPTPGVATQGSGAIRMVLGGFLAAVAFLPFLLVARFPSQDGPAHVHTAGLLALLQAGEAPNAARFVMPHDPGFTNILAPWLLSLLLKVLPPAQAEWALTLGITALLFGAVLLGLRLMRGRLPDAALGVLLCAPVMLYMGSHNLVLGTAFGFAALAFAARHLETGRARDALLFLGTTVVGCAANIQVTIPVLAAVFGGVAGSLAWRRIRGGTLRPARSEVTLLAAALPLIGLAVLYKLVMRENQFTFPAWYPQRNIGALLLRGDVAWFWYSDLVLFGVLAFVVWGVALWWLLRRSAAAAPAGPVPWAFWGAVAIAGLIIVVPTETQTVPQIPMRIAPFAHFLLFLWFCAAPLPQPARRGIVALALVTGLSLLVSRSYGHVELAQRLEEMDWAERQIPEGAVVDAIRMTYIGDPWDRETAPHLGGFRLRFNPFIHVGYGFQNRDVANISNYQLMPIWTLFRLRPRPELAEVRGFGHTDIGLRGGAVQGGLTGFRAQLREASGRDLDYVIFVRQGVDVEAKAQSLPVLAGFLRDLQADFARAGQSPQSGLTEIWRRRDLPAAPGPAAQDR